MIWNGVSFNWNLVCFCSLAGLEELSYTYNSLFYKRGHHEIFPYKNHKLPFLQQLLDMKEFYSNFTYDTRFSESLSSAHFEAKRIPPWYGFFAEDEGLKS